MQRVKLIQVISRQHDVKNVQKVLFSGLDLFGRSALKGGWGGVWLKLVVLVLLLDDVFEILLELLLVFGPHQFVGYGNGVLVLDRVL